MMAKICLVVLCGVPASGKTTLAKHLKVYIEQSTNINTKNKSDSDSCQNSTTCRVISYDELLPHHVEKSLIENSNTGETWKNHRRSILNMVSRELAEALADKGYMNEQRETLHHETKMVFIIDDNMYYRGMRYEYFQLARKYTTGFAQVFLRCPIKEALKRNSERSVKVHPDIIPDMDRKLEAPDTSNSWEQFTYTADTQDESAAEAVISEVWELIELAMAHPVQSLPPGNAEEKASDRLVCSASVIHQADRIVRGLVSKHIQRLKDEGNSELKETAAILSKLKSSFLSDIRADKVSFPADLEQYVNESCIEESNPFNICIQKEFMRLSGVFEP